MGDPTRRARTAQARAFLDLCMLDRAWIRLKELEEEDPGDPEVLELTARMFIERGWPNRARKPLERALALAPANPRLTKLWERAQQPPVHADPELESSHALSVLLPLAERYLATGAMIKGRSLLERLRREHAQEPRVEELLWVLDGDFSLGGLSLAELADRFGPDLSMLADLSDEAEHTESITLDELHVPPMKESAAFPSLFRAASPRDLDGETESEVTRATSLADLPELRRSVEAARRAAGFVSGEEDTQIRRVIRRDDQVDITDAGGKLHVAPTDPVDLDFDLRKFRQEMGVAEPAVLPESDLEDPLEEEDDDVVILTKRERDAAALAAALDPDPTNESVSHPDAVRFLAEAEHYRQLESGPHATLTPPGARARRPRRRRANASVAATPVWLLVLTILLGIAAFFLFLLVVLQALGS